MIETYEQAIEGLKKNEEHILFADMAECDQEILKQIFKECQYLDEQLRWIGKVGVNFLLNGCYRIRPDYQPEPKTAHQLKQIILVVIDQFEHALMQAKPLLGITYDYINHRWLAVKAGIDRLDAQQQEIAELGADKVQLENDACVAQGEIKRLKQRNKDLVTENQLLRASINDHQLAIDNLVAEKQALTERIERLIKVLRYIATYKDHSVFYDEDALASMAMNAVEADKLREREKEQALQEGK